MVTNNTVLVAIAILEGEGKFLLQLRDDLPHILYPGHWGLFGGHIEPGETPEQGLKRELWEEISYEVVAPQLFRCYTGDQIVRYVYYSPLTVPVQNLIQKEGQDLALVAPDEIARGHCFSQKIGQFRPLGQFHQQIMLDFVRSTSMYRDKELP